MNLHPTVALLYAQTDIAAKFANEAVASLAAQPEIARRTAAETANQERQQVQGAQKGDPSGKLIGEGGDRNSRQFGNRRRRRAHVQTVEEEAAPPPADALLGNLLNLKI